MQLTKFHKCFPQVTKHVAFPHTPPILTFPQMAQTKWFPWTFLLPCIWKKKECFKWTNLLVVSSLTCQPTLLFSTPFLMTKMQQAWPQNILKLGLAHYSSFLHKLPIIPLNGFFHIGKHDTSLQTPYISDTWPNSKGEAI